MGGGPKPEHLLAILPFPEPTGVFDRIRKKHPHIIITYWHLIFSSFDRGLQDVPKELYHDATILVTLSTLPKSLEDCPNLKLIHFFSAGVNHIAHTPIYTETSITSDNIVGVTLTALAHSRSYPLLHTWQEQHYWPHGPSSHNLFSNRDKVGQRLGVLGYGSIGRHVARIFSAMGMSVTAFTAHKRTTPDSKKDKGFIIPNTGDPDGSIPEAWHGGFDKASLHEFLSQDIDHLLISVPLTESTTHLIGKAEFDILGRGNRNAFISNISRGQIIMQNDLIAALNTYDQGVKAGKTGDELTGLRGAALDVTDPEPLPKDHLLWDTPNCIITPHISGLGSMYTERAFEVLEVNMGRRERGEEMLNVVDRKRGY